ncbi:hypothetical protein M0R45_009303 [Rubus argutus]|uniref:Uncharacterized protein n=1 Tax=Rubus argutus TaxID=59490 RepID=A0AAW1Y456_RUBAR
MRIGYGLFEVDMAVCGDGCEWRIGGFGEFELGLKLWLGLVFTVKAGIEGAALRKLMAWAKRVTVLQFSEAVAMRPWPWGRRRGARQEQAAMVWMDFNNGRDGVAVSCGTGGTSSGLEVADSLVGVLGA